jgi:hypothetical protein
LIFCKYVLGTPALGAKGSKGSFALMRSPSNTFKGSDGSGKNQNQQNQGTLKVTFKINERDEYESDSKLET